MILVVMLRNLFELLPLRSVGDDVGHDQRGRLLGADVLQQAVVRVLELVALTLQQLFHDVQQDGDLVAEVRVVAARHLVQLRPQLGHAVRRVVDLR